MARIRIHGYFEHIVSLKIYSLIEMEKLAVTVISFDGSVLDWYCSQGEREAFISWDDLK